MSIFRDKTTVSDANNGSVSVPTISYEHLESAERKSARDYRIWLRNQITWYQNELADVEAFLRGEQDDVGETDSANE